MAAEFQRGGTVEVCGTQEGFEGSYFAATIVSQIGAGELIVEYRSLLTDDKMAPLREIVSAGDIRPIPPEIQVAEFMPREEVDAWDNDGWWGGKVVKRWRQSNLYRVDFQLSGDVNTYKLHQLRVHSDWVDGRWISSTKRL